MVRQDVGRTTEALRVPEVGRKMAKVRLELRQPGEIEEPVIVLQPALAPSRG
jgi:hypothetical protein